MNKSLALGFWILLSVTVGSDALHDGIQKRAVGQCAYALDQLSSPRACNGTQKCVTEPMLMRTSQLLSSGFCRSGTQCRKVGGLMCDNCYRAYSNGTCQTKTPPCRLRFLHSCFRQKVIAERTFLYIRTGCTMYCRNVDGGTYIHHINKCCRNADFCNRQ